jgi:hypothetical protein
MPLPTPHKKTEDQNAFMQRCMHNDNIKSDFPTIKQRLAVCESQWRRKKSKASWVTQSAGNEYIYGDIDLTDTEIAEAKKEAQYQ